jgi:hypothetical protein
MIATKTMMDTIVPHLKDAASTPTLLGVQRVLGAAAINAAAAEQDEEPQPVAGESFGVGLRTNIKELPKSEPTPVKLVR